VSRDRERIVELVRLPSRVETDMAVAVLRDAGITATAAYGDAEGWAPHLALFSGDRVMVFEGDVDAARAALVDAQILEP
jgi:hypothetical protein